MPSLTGMARHCWAIPLGERPLRRRRQMVSIRAANGCASLAPWKRGITRRTLRNAAV